MGYNWSRGKSDRAVAAEEEGLFPASEIAKRLKLPSAACVKEHIRAKEWHHTSGWFNKTDYYDLEECTEFFKTPEGSKIIAEEKAKKKKKGEVKTIENAVVMITTFEKKSGRYIPTDHSYYQVKIEVKEGSSLVKVIGNKRTYHQINGGEIVLRSSPFQIKKREGSSSFRYITGDEAAEMIAQAKKRRRRELELAKLTPKERKARLARAKLIEENRQKRRLEEMKRKWKKEEEELKQQIGFYKDKL